MKTALFLLVFYIGHVTCQNQPPVFVNNMDKLTIYESVLVGTSVYTLYATDETAVTYHTDSQLFSVEEISGVVRLRQPLDYDAGVTDVQVTVWAEDTMGLKTTSYATVSIEDDNDNAPAFSGGSYQATIPENFPVNGLVIDNLVVNDVDFRGLRIEVTCSPQAAQRSNPDTLAYYEEACSTFSTVQTNASNRYWTGRVFLSRPLDFEKRGSYQIPFETSDGTNKGFQSIEILVSDVDDSPPVFYNVTETLAIQENLPLNTIVGWAIARDGDRTNPRDIVYETTNCPVDSPRGDGSGVFSVDRETSLIRTISSIDREDPLFVGGLFLCVKAREVISATTVGDDAETTSVTMILINIVDLNDETPTFNVSNYNTSIYEDIANGSPVPGVALTIEDHDLAPANEYEIRLRNYNDVFELFPSSGSGTSVASIKVTDSSKIDYESAVKKYELYVIAEETVGVNRKRGQTATVTIHVLDRNDNSPRFYFPSYNASVEETDPGDLAIISNILAVDPDSGWMGTSGLSYSLIGSEFELFEIVTIPRRGLQIRVKPCSTPGREACIDYERRSRYDFTIVAADMQGDPRGNQGAANLTIHILDVNDNKPVFRFNSYQAAIFEGQSATVDPLVVDATDIDTLGTLTYRLDPTDQSRYWTIHPTTGVIRALQPIFNAYTPGSRGWFDINVIADDTVNEAVIDVRINVIEVNTFTPYFTNLDNSTSIREDIGAGASIFTVSARDDDPITSANGQIQFTIEFGARGKFMVDLNTGVVRTQKDATFDFDLETQYVLTVLARDGGTPQRTGTGSLTVNILDLNNKLPYFTPRVQITEIQENAPINTLVTRIDATDLDRNHVLVFNLVEPVTAINPDGLTVDRALVDYPRLFRVNERTGEVFVARSLDRDLASLVTYTMTVTDIYNPNNPQRGETGQLQIQILEYNDQSPEFQQTVYNLTVEEEQAIGTFIVALVARDEDDEIERYEIVDGDRNYFLLTPDTGELNVRRRLDYETLKRVEFTVQAWDTGSPQRSGTAKVYINIVNINDNTPLPFEGTYYVTIPEHTPGGTSVLQISATDGDEGDYGEVRYSLPDSVTDFTIDSITGVLRFSERGEFDREKTPTLTTTVVIYDSPLDQSVRRSSNVQVYVSLSDINDNTPVFIPSEYSTEVIESIDIGAQILQVFATDADEGTNALILYEKVPRSGDPDGLFEIGSRSGRISVAKRLVRKVGVYRFLVSAKDRGGGPGYRVGYSTVNITVLESLNSPPEWFIPPYDNMTVEVLENQYLGMLVFDAHANDTDSGNNGLVEYYFQVSGREVSRTREFRINKVTGVIRSEVVFDRETLDRYTLVLVAKDKASRPLIAERFFNVRIIDVNDNAPEFPMEDGVVKNVHISVPEDVTVNSFIGEVSATDRDLPQYTKIYYHIIAGGKGKFAVGLETGVITLINSADREEQEVYVLEIRATNGERVDSSATQLLYHDVDPSVVRVTITLQDVNDVKPYFINFNGPRSDVLEYYGFIYTGSAFDQGVVQVSATDDDYDDISRIRYDITSGNDEGVFAININGLITNLRLLDGYEGQVFNLIVSATDQKWTATAPVKVFVAGGGHEVKVVVNRNQDDIAVITPQLIRQVESIAGVDYAGVTRITNHIASSAVSSKSDVYVVAATAVPGGGHRLLSSDELMSLVSADRQDIKPLYDDLGVSAIGGAAGGTPWYDRVPVLAALVLVLLLVLLAIILFVLACCCINELDRMRVKPGEKGSSTGDEAVLVDNPVFSSGPVVTGEDGTKQKTVPTDDVYSTVSKGKSAPSQSVTHDPQPFIEEEEEGPVIVTEVDIGEGAGRPVSIPPDYDGSDGAVARTEGAFASGRGGSGSGVVFFNDVTDGGGNRDGNMNIGSGSGTGGLNKVEVVGGGETAVSGGVVTVGGGGSGFASTMNVSGGEARVMQIIGGGGGAEGFAVEGGSGRSAGGNAAFGSGGVVTAGSGSGFASTMNVSGGEARVLEIIGGESFAGEVGSGGSAGGMAGVSRVGDGSFVVGSEGVYESRHASGGVYESRHASTFDGSGGRAGGEGRGEGGGGSFALGGGGSGDTFAIGDGGVTVVDGGGYASVRRIDALRSGFETGGELNNRGRKKIRVGEGGDFLGSGGTVEHWIEDADENEDNDSVIVATVQGSVMDSPRSVDGARDTQVGEGNGNEDADDDSFIEATVQGSVMDSPRSAIGARETQVVDDNGKEDVDDDSVIVATVQGSVVDSPRSAVIDVPGSPLPSPPPSLNASQDSFSFDLEEATRLYTIKTHDEVDFRSTVLEPVEENSESSSQLNTTNPDSDVTEAFGAPRGSSTLKKPKSPLTEEQSAPTFDEQEETMYSFRHSHVATSGTTMPGNAKGASPSPVSLARAPGLKPKFGRSLQFGSSVQSKHYDPKSHGYDGTIDLYEADSYSHVHVKSHTTA